MRKTALLLVAVALLGMTATGSLADQSGSKMNDSSGSGTGSSMGTGSGSGAGGTMTGAEEDSRSGDKARSESGSAAGSETTDTAKVIKGWSAKKMILNKTVYNEGNEKIGTVEDLIVTPDNSISYAIIGVGGFLGMGEHYVAVPVSEIKKKQDKLTMAGATKEELKRMPKFEYTKKKK